MTDRNGGARPLLDGRFEQIVEVATASLAVNRLAGSNGGQ
jgi:hypothetical protein